MKDFAAIPNFTNKPESHSLRDPGDTTGCPNAHPFHDAADELDLLGASRYIQLVLQGMLARARSQGLRALELLSLFGGVGCAANTLMSKPEHSFDFSVLFYREDSEWTAVALEMDVRGYGPSKDQALRDLVEMLAAQISFAVQQGHPESVWRKAEQKYWAMFEDARRDHLIAEVSGSAARLDIIADHVAVPLNASQPTWAEAGA